MCKVAPFMSRYFQRGSVFGAFLATLLSATPLFSQQDDPPPPDVPAATPEELFGKGSAAYNAGNWEEADAAFTAFLDDYGDAPEVAEAVKKLTPFLALARVRLKKFDEALPLVTESLARDDLDAAMRSDLAFWKGLCLMQTGQALEAQIAFGEFYQAHYYQKTDRNLTRCHEALILFGVGFTLREMNAEAAEFLAWQLPKLRRESPEAAARVTVLLLYALLEGDQLDEALKFVRAQFEGIGQVTQLISFQSLALELGSRFLDAGEYHKAIACLQRVWPRERLIRHQSARLEDLRKKVVILKQRRGMEDFVFQYDGMVRRIELELANFQDIENFDSALRLRLASAFMGLERFREAGLILENMVATMPPDPIVEGASFTAIQCWMQVEAWPRAVANADAYLEKFGTTDQNERVPDVLLLKGDSLRSDSKYDEAFAVFSDLVERFPTGDIAPRAVFMQGLVKLNVDENDLGATYFREVQKRFPQHPIAEDAFYWEGMGYSFAKKYQKARERLAAYLKAHPKGRYVLDSEFRRAFCLQALADYEGAAQELAAFVKANPEAAYVNEARLLLGDALLAVGEIDKGIASYKAIDPVETKFFEEGWFKIGKALRLQEKLPPMRAHFETFAKTYPGSNRAAEAVYWIGWTYRTEEQPEKARDIYWETLRASGDHPEYFGMEDILAALPKVYAGGKNDPQLRIDLTKLATEATEASKETLALRAYWALGNLLAKDNPNAATIAFSDAAKLCDPALHNPRLLADCADFKRQSGDLATAEKLYRGLRKWHPRAFEKERAYFGLGMIARAKGENDEALSHFERFESETFGTPLLGEVLLEKARILAETKHPDDARKTYEELLENKVLGSREKADALYELGTLLAAGGDDMKAIAYFERLYLVYGKYRELVARAYYARGQSLERLQKKDAAIEVYAELIGREELAEFGESKEARSRLTTLGGKL